MHKHQCKIAAMLLSMDFILSENSISHLVAQKRFRSWSQICFVCASIPLGIFLCKMLIPLVFLSPQKQACMLIRNLVSRSRDFSQPILEMGAENLITEARATHRDCDDVAKAALRDLGCKVELRELWTGQKGSLAQ